MDIRTIRPDPIRGSILPDASSQTTTPTIAHSHQAVKEKEWLISTSCDAHNLRFSSPRHKTWDEAITEVLQERAELWERLAKY